MSKTVTFAALFLMLVSGTTRAIEDTPENRSEQADRYMAATPRKEIIHAATESLAENLPVTQQAEFKSLMNKYLDIPALEKSMKDCMVKLFTAEELKALADFYGSPVGKSVMTKSAIYTRETTPLVHAAIAKARTEANRELSRDSKDK